MSVARSSIVIMAVVSGAFGVGTASAHGPSTRAVIFRAFNGRGKPAIHIIRTVRGTCVGGSAATNRSDAWRCMSGNMIYDPCFSSARATGFVLCGALPWHRFGVKLKLTGPLTLGHHGPPSTSGLPWAIKTMSGAKCVIDTGATNAIHGVRANYYCTNPSWLWGSPSRRSEPWTILSAPESATALTHRVKIRTAWF